MTHLFRIARFDGDGIGSEIMAEATKVIDVVADGFTCDYDHLRL